MKTNNEINEMNAKIRKDIDELKFYWNNTDEEVLSRLEYVIEKAKEMSPVEMPPTIVLELENTDSDKDLVCMTCTENVLAMLEYIKYGPITAKDTLADSRVLH
jgi:hypothetical protein